MNNIRVIGVGSPYGIDQLGWWIIDQLKTKNPVQSTDEDTVTYICADRPGVRLLDYLKDIDSAIIIDAIDEPAHKDQILILNKAQLLNNGYNLSSHEPGISYALALGDAIGGLPANLILAGLCVDAHSNEMPNEELISSLTNTVIDTLTSLHQEKSASSSKL